jgi:uncharacterized membrane protein
MSRATKWLITGLCISLGLNLLIFGFGAARYMGYGGMPPHMSFSMGRMMSRLSEDSQQILRDAVAEQRQPIGDKMRGMHQGHLELVALLGAEELDSEALDKAFADQRQRSADLQADLQAAIVKVAQQLAPEERVKLAQGGDRMMRRMMDRRHTGPMGHEHGGNGPPPHGAPAQP